MTRSVIDMKQHYIFIDDMDHLTPFCRELTGISARDLGEGTDLGVVVREVCVF